jgi:hypothetical protein
MSKTANRVEMIWLVKGGATQELVSYRSLKYIYLINEDSSFLPLPII